MNPIVESVPNFSEGRDAAKIDAIIAAIRSVPGAFLLDRSSDVDHNRTVITVAGEPAAILEASVRAVGKAAEIINLREHAGVHPRIGATDVLPFVPVEGISLEECAGIARRAGQEIWQRYQIPVYFYEAAATLPGRKNLESVRKGQFEGLFEEVVHDPGRAPDIGSANLHPTAGATAIGARKFLIAFNINLDTPDVQIAKAVAKTIRFSSGGLPFVKAMGVDLHSRGLAQVSMNLTDFEQTSIAQVFEAVEKEAARHGVRIAGSEIVGLVSQRALAAVNLGRLMLENFSSNQVFENRLSAAMKES